MKHFSNIFKSVLFLSLVVAMASCGGSDDPGPGEDTTLADALAGLIKGQANFNSVVKPTGATDLDWSAMTIQFSGTVDGGTYATTNSADATVWPASGTWVFTDATGTKVTRDDGVVVTIRVGTQLETEFTIPEPGGRTKVVSGGWLFTYDYQ
ncbi:MAG: hypothetical protein ABJF04_25350 [Reichenbachiella sp.]|uniref:hypothetical protein n=2 Tax=Reichenbachiella sp. TaxID=2184521 RepID=UPI0032678EDA